MTRPKISAEKSEKIEVTEEYREVLSWLKAGEPIVFLTGKAGNGKSTLIRYLREELKENIVVVAPTGVAALHVNGSTIHSFFRFPPRILTQDDIKPARDRKLYAKMSLLIIDEISMVRADMLDAIDSFLRLNRNSQEPFGGVQLLLVGDLFQLPPVLQRNELDALQTMSYDSPYFFSAKALNGGKLAWKELTKIYRQTDENFVELLNRVRVADAVDELLPALNQRVSPHRGSDQTAITLTCTNRVADTINELELGKLPGEEQTFTGEVSGKFSLSDEKLPAPMELSLKEGAQVMFTKNNEKKVWVNGTLGRVSGFEENGIRVEVTNQGRAESHLVQRAVWESFSYKYDDETDRIVPERAGTYCQYPLMLAWAVTIHKSQGKTLEKVRIDLGNGAFDYGQVYVALSRCRSLRDIHLVQLIKKQDIKCDPAIQRFYAGLPSPKRNIGFAQAGLHSDNGKGIKS